jgi:hypothetical protein
MPNKKAGERARRSPKLKTITVTCRSDNANEIKEGDQFTIRPGEDFKDGELVAFKRYSDIDEISVAYLYRCKGKQWAYYGKYRVDINSRTMYDGHNIQILGPVVDALNSKPETVKPEAKRRSRSESLCVVMDMVCPALGLYKGDEIVFRLDDTAPVGKFIGVYCGQKIGAWFARVCLNDERGIYLLLRSGKRNWLAEYEYKSFGPVVKIERASEANAKKIAALKERLEKIRRNDWDSICDTTRLYDLERELYALENPIEEEDDWPEVIGAKP